MKLYLKFCVFFFLTFSNLNYCQQKSKPKLIVGIIIDQMRAEYLYRFQDNYSENGFKRILNKGFNVKNVHYNYIPTATAPGHSTVFTGTTPSEHGIIYNSWFDRKKNKVINCIEDNSVFLVDNNGISKDLKSKKFQRSPKNLKVTTITDELKLFTNGRSKVIGISLKDRGAILPAGHLADAAYWYNTDNGNFITSSYYQKKLPFWLKQFNNKKLADSLLNSNWSTLLPIKRYINSNIDNSPFEKIFKGRNNSTFPYNLKNLRRRNNNYNLLTQVPQGNSILTKLFREVIIGENLGKRNETDFLTISYSSTDYIGHNFGIRSKEVEDTYVRMDREIEEVIDILNKQVGKDQYILFLTSDHGGSDNPLFLNSKRLPGNFYSPKEIKKKLNIYLSKEFSPKKYISYFNKTQIYLNPKIENKIEVLKKIKQFLQKNDGIKKIYIPALNSRSINDDVFVNSYNPEVSGDIIYEMYSGWMVERKFGTTHASNYNNDSHVPLIWYGKNINRGETSLPVKITQIAPTISMLLNIPLPNVSNKNPIVALISNNYAITKKE